MNITVFGAGYVGLVTAVCYAKLGHSVVCMDINHDKMARLQQGIPTLFEQGLEPLLQEQLQSQRLQFSTALADAVAHGSILVIAVGTPTDEDGEADLSHVYQVVRGIGHHLQQDATVIIKSTVPPGTADKVQDYLRQALQHRRASFTAPVVSNPEFLQEGSAISQFMQPDRVIVGASDVIAIQQLYDLHQPLLQHKHQFIVMSRSSAELTKYAANAFLATKISFINEMGQLAEKIGADINDVKHGIGADPRINPLFLNAGCGFGGSCFPKDLMALNSFAKTHDVSTSILSAVLERNRHAQRQLFHRVREYFQHDLNGKTIALWGLTFKPNTDDVRYATSLSLVELFADSGANLQLYDPMGMENFRVYHPNSKRLIYANSALAALQGADALVIATEWDCFKAVPLATIIDTLRHPAIFDGRQLWSLATVKPHAVHYYSTGRPTLKPSVNPSAVDA